MNIEQETDFIKGMIFRENLEIGINRFRNKRVTENDITIFAEISCDHNPGHLGEKFAYYTVFGKKIAHRMLTVRFISSVLGEYLPGYGTIYLRQTLDFFRPVFPEQIVKTTVIIDNIDYKKKKGCLECKCSIEDRLVLGGMATGLATTKQQIK